MLEKIKNQLLQNADTTGIKFYIGDTEFSSQEIPFNNTYMEESTYNELCKLYNKEQQEAFFRELEFDFVSVSKKGNLDFIHITDYEKTPTIESEGLYASMDWIPNLGTGIYVWDYNDPNKAVSMSQFKHHNKNTDTTEIRGTFHGEYHKCIFSDSNYVACNHVGYIVLKTLQVPAEDILKKALI